MPSGIYTFPIWQNTWLFELVWRTGSALSEKDMSIEHVLSVRDGKTINIWSIKVEINECNAFFSNFRKYTTKE